MRKREGECPPVFVRFDSVLDSRDGRSGGQVEPDRAQEEDQESDRGSYQDPPVDFDIDHAVLRSVDAIIRFWFIGNGGHRRGIRSRYLEGRRCCGRFFDTSEPPGKILGRYQTIGIQARIEREPIAIRCREILSHRLGNRHRRRSSGFDRLRPSFRSRLRSGVLQRYGGVTVSQPFGQEQPGIGWIR